MLGIVNYGMGNLGSVHKALEYLGYDVVITSDTDRLAETSGLILPGVGSFQGAMQNLQQAGLDTFLREQISNGRPFLGICLGLQLLFETGFEQGEHPGLGILPGQVVCFQLGPEYKVPHVGWNQIYCRGSLRPAICDGVPDGSYQYFVHSYHVCPQTEDDILLVTDYGPGFVSGIHRDHIYGFQFHPEKSGERGLQLLDNFGRMVYGAHSSR